MAVARNEAGRDVRGQLRALIGATAFAEHACARLVRDVEAEGYRLTKDMKGTVVSVYGGGEAYAVEFLGLEAGMAVVTIGAADLAGNAN
ncbi:MAG: hypothetical protein IPN12_05420 [Rhodocyclaceae bacterium]|jgi:hypothetical protein|nr:hypothetical protein [Rhodocyclaceae bacterium]MBK6677530.1 hypothetical protein [Rhodocyclaceae bacterium]MBK9310188.1 hypothetical protein [Rhodocyclaceae bacterium]